MRLLLLLLLLGVGCVDYTAPVPVECVRYGYEMRLPLYSDVDGRLIGYVTMHFLTKPPAAEHDALLAKGWVVMPPDTYHCVIG